MQKSENMDIINLFEKETTLNAILYITEKNGGKIDMHKLFKTLYFADQESLSRYGRTITRDVYIAMQYGPVPSKTDDILKAVRGDSFFKAGDLGRYFHFINEYTIANDMCADMDWLSESDIICLDNSIKRCKDKNFRQLVEMSHGEAWSRTGRDTRIHFSEILREVGSTEEYIDYVEEQMQLSCFLR